MEYDIRLAGSSFGEIGIVGHAGCGHANSHLGFIQDDSGGLSAVTGLLQKATGADLTIESVRTKIGREGAYFEVRTAEGGVGRAFARRGITIFEDRLAQYCVGRRALCSQALAVECFGRILGQGAMEVPVALQTAIANAALESFKKCSPMFFDLAEEGVEGNCGLILGGTIAINGLPVSVMALSNATAGGIGPNEDIEGNVPFYGKAAIMEKLHLTEIPTFVVEGKVCAAPFSETIGCPTFLIRAFAGDDNTEAAYALLDAAWDLKIPAEYRPELLGRSDTAMEDLTRKQAQYLQDLALKLSQARTAREKVLLAAELNRFASEELGGITFMSSDVHKVMGGVGCIPGTSCVLSLFISEEQLKKDVLPRLEKEDVENYDRLLCAGVLNLAGRLKKAKEELKVVRDKYSAKAEK